MNQECSRAGKTFQTEQCPHSIGFRPVLEDLVMSLPNLRNLQLLLVELGFSAL